MPPTVPDLAETARRVARQLTALADELVEAAPEPASAPAAYLRLPEGVELSPARVGDLQRALAAALRLPVTVAVLPGGAEAAGPSDPDVQDYAVRNT